MIVTTTLDKICDCMWTNYVDDVIYVGDDRSVTPSEYGFARGFYSLRLSEKTRKVIEDARPQYNDEQKLFDEVVKPQYKAQVEGSAEAMACLEKLVKFSNAGQRIAICTDGEDKKTDIRTVLARYLRNMGAKVIWH